MPLADECRLISAVVGKDGKRGLRSVELLGVGGYAVEVTKGAGEDGRSARCADRVLDEVTIEDDSFIGDSVYVRRLVPVGSVGGNRLPGVVVRHYEDDVGSIRN